MRSVHDYLWESSNPKLTFLESNYLSPRGLAIYRTIAALLMLPIFYFGTFAFPNFVSNIPYLTHWGTTLATLYFICVSLCYWIYKKPSPNNVYSPYAFWKFTQILCEIACTLEIVITPAVWIAILFFHAEDHFHYVWWQNISVHFITGFLIFIDTIISNIKFYKRHWIIIALVIASYLTINYFYTEAEGPVYWVLTWQDDSATYILSIGTMLVFLGAFALGVWITKPKFRNVENKESLETLNTSQNSPLSMV
jgi:hypothetical protein